ncbi:excitatory amino acid transporter 3-like [Anthonomus grandis grandis]|uniref:excitatory amino acid transporter 3-like n=1 Tax=Anthonomus grandis grandis TaxID=2921223 RepID=UPI002165DC8F|nr:excitatory amino acid transporter 3-like [Anthonomus grandis grandis]XP_050296665.1 excitatory amino acid transporter 3-like [Anthonomus grandis grandis]
MADEPHNKLVACIKRNLLTILTVVGVFGGTAVGLLLRAASSTKWTSREIMYLAFPGELFLRMLKCLIIPLLMSSVISAIGSLDLSLSKKIAFRSILFYTATTICAVVLGILLVVVIRPGEGTVPWKPVDEDDTSRVLTRHVITQDTLLDLIRNFFPPNLVQACVGQSQTFLHEPNIYTLYKKGNQDILRSIVGNSTLDSESKSAIFDSLATSDNKRRLNESLFKELKKIKYNSTHYGSVELEDIYSSEKWKFEERYESTTNVLGLVTFSIVFGIAMGQLGEKGKVLLDFFHALSEAMMIITSWVIWLSPVGVFFLVVAKVLEIVSFADLVGRLGLYFMTVLLGLFIHGFITLSIIYFVTLRRLPFKVIAQLSQVLITAFGTASSQATMPISIQTMDKMGLDPRVTRFVIPIGATINMDGTALYEAVAAIFIAQLNNISLGFGKTIAVCLTATAASIGAAGIPQAGLVTMVMVLDTVGLPADAVINIIAVDWLLDRFRTTINVMCDCLGARLVDILSVGELAGTAVTKDRLNAAEPHELIEMAKNDQHI